MFVVCFRRGHHQRPIQERVMGIEPTQPAWKAGALPLSYTRRWGEEDSNLRRRTPADLQSAPIDHSGIPPPRF